MYDPTSGCIREGVPQDITRTLRKRMYLIEKARNANIVGGTPCPCSAKTAPPFTTDAHAILPVESMRFTVSEFRGSSCCLCLH